MSAIINTKQKGKHGYMDTIVLGPKNQADKLVAYFGKSGRYDGHGGDDYLGSNDTCYDYSDTQNTSSYCPTGYPDIYKESCDSGRVRVLCSVAAMDALSNWNATAYFKPLLPAIKTAKWKQRHFQVRQQGMTKLQGTITVTWDIGALFTPDAIEKFIEISNNFPKSLNPNLAAQIDQLQNKFCVWNASISKIVSVSQLDHKKRGGHGPVRHNIKPRSPTDDDYKKMIEDQLHNYGATANGSSTGFSDYCKNLCTPANSKCTNVIQTLCQGDNLNSDECTNFCGSDYDCDVALTDYCKDPNNYKLDICQCFLPLEERDKRYAESIKGLPDNIIKMLQNIRNPASECSSPGCVPTYYSYAYRKSGKKCPDTNINACIQTVKAKIKDSPGTTFNIDSKCKIIDKKTTQPPAQEQPTPSKEQPTPSKEKPTPPEEEAPSNLRRNIIIISVAIGIFLMLVFFGILLIFI